MEYLLCPLCGESPRYIDKVSTSKIAKLYKERYNYDVTYLFKETKELHYLQCMKCGLRYFDPIITGDDDFYKRLQEEPWYYLHDDKSEYSFAARYIKKDDNVLDIGSGRGVFKQYIDCNFYQGLDFSSKAIELAKLDGVNVQAIPIQEHCLEKKCFYDVIVLFQIIEHIQDVDIFIESSIKALKENGYLIIATPDNDGFIKDVSNFYLNLPPHHVLHWNEQSLAFIAAKYNLNIEAIYREPVAEIHKEWWHITIINKHINKFLRRKKLIVDLRLLSWFIHAGAVIVGKVAKLMSLHKKATGQSIIMVYKK
jgi:2-polyprenyl-3-methyl-5-hydroxy-6-metoxy-1,4-benzoquinol methylase